MIDRRKFLQTAAFLATAPLAACRTVIPSGEFGHGVDAHCHVFNASDLPAARFIRFVFLEHYPETEGVRLLDIQDPSIVDRLIQLFLLVLDANEAPTAAAETAVLDNQATAEPEHANEAQAAKIAIAALAGYVRQSQQLVEEKGTVGALSAGEQKVLGAILQAGGGGASITAADKQNLGLVARNAFFSPTDIGTYLRWFNLFTLYRHVLVDRLASDAKKQGLDPTLLAPATVDYDRWLGESVKSSLSDQIAVMGRIARRRTGPAVHGYFGFDPLREIYFRESRGNERQSPLALARSALTEHGFLGIKLYPPMGFRASRNAGPYPSRIWNELGGDPSRRLDAVLQDLYRLCVELDAPILTHAYASNGANKDFELRADPAYWLPVFRSYPTLRVCLAHFGGVGGRHYQDLSRGQLGVDLRPPCQCKSGSERRRRSELLRGSAAGRHREAPAAGEQHPAVCRRVRS
jgi:hypothetical protein